MIKKHSLILIAVVIAVIAIFYIQKFLLPADQTVKGLEPAEQPVSAGLSATYESVSNTVRATPQAEANPESPGQTNPSTPKDKYIEKLKNAGYTLDPENPTLYIKKSIDKSGQEKISTVEVDIGPAIKDIDETYVNELLARKQSEDPAIEILTLSDMDDNFGQSTLLSGRFRDEATDTEVKIQVAYDDDMKSKLGFPVCLVAKKLNLDFVSIGYTVKANEEGYGLVDFKNGYFLRAMSFFDQVTKRVTLSGYILYKQNDRFQVVQKFRGQAVKSLDGEKLKHCDNRKFRM